MKYFNISFVKSMIILICNTIWLNLFISFMKLWRIIFMYLKNYFSIFVVNFFIYKIFKNVIKFFLNIEFKSFITFICKRFNIFILIFLWFFFKSFFIFLIVFLLLHFGLFIALDFLRRNFKKTLHYWLNLFFIFLGGIFVYSYE